MTPSRIGLKISFFAVAIGLTFCAAQVRAQEPERRLSGEIISGYSSMDLNGDTVQGPYMGFIADLAGSYKDARILTYDVRPNYSRGFQWAGPMSGPDANGISAESTF